MIEVTPVAKDGLVVVVDSFESLDSFKKLVQRGANLWPDAPPEIKEFADYVTNADLVELFGGPLQKYKRQDTSTKQTENSNG